eukprot:96951_1
MKSSIWWPIYERHFGQLNDNEMCMKCQESLPSHSVYLPGHREEKKDKNAMSADNFYKFSQETARSLNVAYMALYELKESRKHHLYSYKSEKCSELNEKEIVMDDIQSIEYLIRDDIVCEFKMITTTNNEDRYDDKSKLQKKGDNESILDAVFARFGNITDQYVDFEIKWSEDCDRLSKLEEEWNEFAELPFVGDGSNREEEDRKRVGMEGMFDVLKGKWVEVEQERDGLLDEILEHLQKAELLQEIKAFYLQTIERRKESDEMNASETGASIRIMDKEQPRLDEHESKHIMDELKEVSNMRTHITISDIIINYFAEFKPKIVHHEDCLIIIRGQWIGSYRLHVSDRLYGSTLKMVASCIGFLFIKFGFLRCDLETMISWIIVIIV